MITYRRMTFTLKDGCVLIAGWFLFNRWAILRYVTMAQPPDEVTTQ